MILAHLAEQAPSELYLWNAECTVHKFQRMSLQCLSQRFGGVLAENVL